MNLDLVKLQFKLILLIVFLTGSILVISLEYKLSSQQKESITATFLQGGHEEIIRGLAYDESGNKYQVGLTSSSDLLTNPQFEYHGDNDGFLRKSDSSGNTLWSLYIGGSKSDSLDGVVIDSENNIIVVGTSNSSSDDDFKPKITGADISKEKDHPDAVILKYNSNGILVWGTYLGGGGREFVTNIDIDSQDNIIITGFTNSQQDMGQINAHGGKDDGFVTKYTPDGDRLWTRYLGGNDSDLIYGLVVDDNDDIIISGFTKSIDFPLLNESKGLSGHRDIFLAKLDSDGEPLLTDILAINSKSSAEFEFEEKIPMVIDDDQNIIMGSWTNATDPYKQDSEFADKDGIIFIVSNSSSYEIFRLRGSADDRITDLVIDNLGNILFTGVTYSFDIPVKNPLFASYLDFGDIFLTKIDPSGALLFSSYLGGNFVDFSSILHLIGDNKVVLMGITSSFDFISSTRNLSGISDIFELTIDFDLIKQLNIPRSVQIFLEYTSVLEWLMLIAAVLFIYQALFYYIKTKINEFLLLAGMFLSLAFSNMIPLLGYAIVKIEISEDFNLIRQPIFGLSITWVLVLLHAFRLKWEQPPTVHKILAVTLLALKILVPIINLISPIRDQSVGLSIIFTILFVSFDIYVIIILMYSYFTIELITPTKRIIRVYKLWRITWSIFMVGYLFLITMTAVQMALISLQDTSVNLDLLLIIFRTLSGLYSSGVYVFIVFILIGFISVYIPEGLLISQAQVTAALSMYSAVLPSTQGSKNLANIMDYLQQSKAIIEANQ